MVCVQCCGSRSGSAWIRIILGKLDPDPHQSEKMEALDGHFGALEGPNLEKSERYDLDPNKLIDRIRIRIRVKNRIWIHGLYPCR